MALSVLNAVGILDIRDFGAVGDTSEGSPPGTPCAAALQAAIRALDPQRGGQIYLPYAPSGGYYFDKPVLVDRPVYIHGAGRSGVDPAATCIYAAPGVTPLIFVGPLETDMKTGGNSGATGFIIEKLNISSLGKNTNRQNASFDIARPDRVTVKSVGDFAVNQVVRVGGAGQRQYYYRTKVDTHPGSNRIDGAFSDVYGAGVPGLRVGMWIMVPGAHEHPVKVSSGECGNTTVGAGAGASFTVVNGDGNPANAIAIRPGADVQSSGVQYCDDFYGRIMDIQGNVLVLDTTAFGTIGRGDHPNHPKTEVTHASCGIYSRVFGTIRDVFVGNKDPRFDMEGCGVLLYGDHGSTPYSNLNGWRCEHLFTYGCQHGLKILGTDANAGTNDQSLHLDARSWTIIDYSFLGNVHINPQMSGGTGIITTDNPPSRTVIIGPYNEGGTPSNFGVGTDWLGGTVASDPGGAGAGAGTWNKLCVGAIEIPNVFQCQTLMQPAGAMNGKGGITGRPNFLNFQMAGGSAGGLSLRKLDLVPSIVREGTVVEGGSGYNVADTLTVQGGSFTASAQFNLTSVKVAASRTVVAGGTGYNVRDILTLQGGTFTAAAQFEVTSVECGAVKGVKLVQPGSYTVLPASPAPVKDETTGAATGATLALTVVTGGSGYNVGDILTVQGGTGSAAQFEVTSVKVAEHTVVTSGNGYRVGDILTVEGGTGNAAQFEVTSIQFSTRAITGVKLVQPGLYTVLPPSPVHVKDETTGAATGATLALNTFAVAEVKLVQPGSYTLIPLSPAHVKDETTSGGKNATLVLNTTAVAEVELVQPGSYTELPPFPAAVAVLNKPAAAGATLALTFSGDFAFIHESRGGSHPIVVVDLVGEWSKGSSVGDLVLGQGFWLGENMVNNFPNLPRASHWTGDVFEPGPGPHGLGLKGAQRFHIYSQPFPGGYVGWAGTASSDPNPWTTFGEIISNDILEFDVTAGGPTFELTDIQAAHRVIRVTGTPTSERSIVIKTPDIFRQKAKPTQPNTIWRIIHNHNQSGQALKVKATSLDDGIVVGPEQSSILWSDGSKFSKLS
jgi:hypothetical protein